MRKLLAISALLVISILLASCDAAETPPYEPTPAIIEEIEEPEQTPIEIEEEPEPEPEPEPLLDIDFSNHGQMSAAYVAFMSDYLYGRAPFTYREYEAANWLVYRLLAMGHDADNIYMQRFYRYDEAIYANIGHHWDGPRADWIWGEWIDDMRYYSQNVVLTVPGQSERTIVVGAHYDTLAVPGASDNASGTALLLESAYHMRNADNYHTIVYVFFGAEEIGLVGAHYFVDNMTDEDHDNLVMMINADVLLEGPDLVFGAGYALAQGQPRQNAVSDQVREIAGQTADEFDVFIRHLGNMIFTGSDHLTFLWAGHTVVMMAGGEVTITGQDVRFQGIFHTPEDNIQHISENWPGKVEHNMRYFSILLDELLNAVY